MFINVSDELITFEVQVLNLFLNIFYSLLVIYILCIWGILFYSILQIVLKDGTNEIHSRFSGYSWNATSATEVILGKAVVSL